MRVQNTFLLRAALATALLAPALSAQFVPVHQSGLEFGQTAPYEFTLGYSFLHANAPAGMCGCFSMNQGVGTFVYNAAHGLGVVADVSGGHANNLSGTSQSISLIDYMFGPRYSWKIRSSRYTPYGQALFGESSELSNYVFAQSVKGFAFMPGGGLKVRLSPHFGWDVEAGWIHSDIANNANNRQNDIRISTGVIFRFAPR